MNASTKKRSLGQFFTKNHFWLKEHILDFIKKTKSEIVFDPFAGGGDLLKVANEIGFSKTIGFDIDKSLSWEINDGLKNIAKIEKKKKEVIIKKEIKEKLLLMRQFLRQIRRLQMTQLKTLQFSYPI